MSNRKHKARRNHFTGNVLAKDAVLIFADDELIEQDTHFKVIELQAIDRQEDAIDRLLIDANFELDVDVANSIVIEDEAISLSSIEPVITPVNLHKTQPEMHFEELPQPTIEPEIKPQLEAEMTTPIEKIMVSKNKIGLQIDNFIRSYFIKRAIQEDTLKTNVTEETSDNESFNKFDTDNFAEESINEPEIKITHSSNTENASDIEALISELNRKTQKNSLLSYSALAFGILALLVCIALTIWSMQAGTKLSKLSELIAIIEDDINEKTGNISNYPLAKIDDTTLSNTNESVKTIDIPIPNKSPIIISNINKEAIINEELETPIVEEKPTRHYRHYKKVTIPSDESVQHRENIASPVNHAELMKDKHKTHKELNDIALANEPRNKEQLNKHKAQDAQKEKELKETANNSKKELKNAHTEDTTWVINIATSKQKDMIKHQATDLIKRGVSVKIIPSIINKETWYRLSSGNFKDKESATVYANKLRHSFNISSAWVAKQ